MKLATTTGDFSLFCPTYEEKIKHIYEAGFKHIDLGMYTITETNPLFFGDDWQKSANDILEYAKSLGVDFVQAHSPNGNPLVEGEPFDILIERTIRSIEVCGMLGIPNNVVHFGWAEGISRKECFERNREFYRKLFPAMEKHNVNVLCENSTSVNMGDMECLKTGADMREFIEFVNHPLFHACWDTGHANCEGPQYNEILDIGEHLYAVHINDNLQNYDAHVMPYFGTINMDEVMTALTKMDYKGYFTFEAGNSFRLPKYRRPFEKNDRLFKPTFMMKKHLENLMYDMGKYMLEQYNCFEE